MKNLIEHSQAVIQLPDSPRKVEALLELARSVVFVDDQFSLELVRGAEVIANQFDDIHLHRLCARTAATVYMHQHFYEQALELITDVIDNYNQENDWLHLSECFQEISEFYFYIGDAAKSSEYINWAVSIWKGMKSPENLDPFRTLQNVAKIYLATGETERAISLLQECSVNFLERNELTSLALSNYYLGLAYKNKKNYVESTQYLGKAIEQYDQLGFVRERIYALTEFGIVLSESGQFQEAHTCFLSALEAANYTANKRYAAKLFLCIGHNYLKNNHIAESSEYFKNVWLIIEQLPDVHLLFEGLYALCRINLKQANPTLAAQYIVSAQNLAKEHPSIEADIQINLLWSEVYHHQEDYRQALKYYQEYHQFEQKLSERRTEIRSQNHQTLTDLRKLMYPQVTTAHEDLTESALALGSGRQQEDLLKLLSGFTHDVNGTLSALKAAANNIETSIAEITTQINAVTDLFPKHIGSRLATMWHQSLSNPIELSNKEIRQNNKTLTVYLESTGIQNGQWYAEKLTKLGVNRNQLDDLMPLLSDSYGVSLVQFAYSVVSLKANAEIVRGSLLKTEKTTHSVSALIKQLKANTFQKEVNLADSLDFAVSLIVNNLKQGIKLVKNFQEAKSGIFRCSPESLSQIWLQLLQNALAAVGNNGEITITVTRTTGHWQVSFANNGPEIPADARTRIFEPFFTTKNKGENTGLGLYMVRRVVEEDLNGAIFVHSSPILTTFTVHLPANL